MTERRFLVDPEDLASSLGDSAFIRDKEHHHLSRVLRLQVGDEVSVFDGAGRGYQGVIEHIARDESRVRLVAADARAVEPAFRLTLAQAIPHHDKMDLIIQKTTEVGVARIVPVLAQRSVLRSRGGADWARLTRWRRIASEAARQSGRLCIPEVCEPIEWPALVATPAPDSPGTRFIFSTEPLDQEPLSSLAAASEVRAALIAVGPEGGWTESEEKLAADAGFVPISLGPRILRSETAGIVAVSLMLFLAGEMGPKPRARG